jgi:hypothetical protein
MFLTGADDDEKKHFSFKGISIHANRTVENHMNKKAHDFLPAGRQEIMGFLLKN